MPEFKSNEEFRDWLNGSPSAWAQALALRSALRVAPLAFDPRFNSGQVHRERMTVALSRCSLLGWAGPKIDTHPSRKQRAAAAAAAAAAATDSANAAANAADAADAAAYAATNAAAANAAAYDATAAAAANAAAADAAAYAAYAANAAAANAAAAIWNEVSADAASLAQGIGPGEFLAQPLWHVSSDWFSESWSRGRHTLEEDGGFGTFIEWYERRIAGKRDGFAFGVDGEALFFERLIDCDEDWWTRPAAEIDTDIAAWVRELSSQNLASDPQDLTAPVFGRSESGRIGIDAIRGNEKLLKDPGAERRHLAAQERIKKVGSELRGNNNADSFAPISDRVGDALGKTLDETEPHILVLETQSLRDTFDIQQAYGPADIRDPLEGDALRTVKDAINALNLLIGSDGFLEEIDTKLLGPDAKQNVPEPKDVVALADVIKADELTDPDADQALRRAAQNAPVPSDPNNRKTSFVVRMSLNLVRWTIDLIVEHEAELSAAALGGMAVGAVTAGVVATGGAGLGAFGLAWLLAKNVKRNEGKWRKIADSAGVTSRNFDLLIEKLDNLPLD